MCGRYLIDIDESEISGIVAEAVKNSREQVSNQLFEGGEIFPSNAAPVIAGNGACFMSWGYPSLIDGRRPHINARSETAAALKTFSKAMALRRCIVPATGYYEWKRIDGKRKEKYIFKLPDSEPMYMAGIHSGGGQYAILTREATAAISIIHDRMPVIIPQALTAVWLNETSDVLKEALTDLCFDLAEAND